MTDAFSIDFQWLDRNTADEAERLTFAEIKITVGGVVITEVEDVNAKTIRPGVRLSAYAMAIWLLDNWWRLLREPERATHSWEMSHCLGGYRSRVPMARFKCRKRWHINIAAYDPYTKSQPANGPLPERCMRYRFGR